MKKPAGVRTVPVKAIALKTKLSVVIAGLVLIGSASTGCQGEIGESALSAEQSSRLVAGQLLPIIAPPILSNVRVSNITATTATITWTTNVPGDTRLTYGPTASRGTAVPPDLNFVTNHSVVLTGLTEGTVYHYLAKSRDALNVGMDVDRTFTIAALDNSGCNGVTFLTCSEKGMCCDFHDACLEYHNLTSQAQTAWERGDTSRCPFPGGRARAPCEAAVVACISDPYSYPGKSDCCSEGNECGIDAEWSQWGHHAPTGRWNDSMGGRCPTCNPVTQPSSQYGEKNGQCLPSCGKAGGNHCAPAGDSSCNGKQSFDSYDCNTCCYIPQLPSCGEAGGNYCAAPGDPSCNGQQTFASRDCNTCCYIPPPLPTCAEAGGNHCAPEGDPSCDGRQTYESSNCNGSYTCCYIPPTTPACAVQCELPFECDTATGECTCTSTCEGWLCGQPEKCGRFNCPDTDNVCNPPGGYTNDCERYCEPTPEPPPCNYVDCEGTCNGDVWDDQCGVCGGDGSSCAFCSDEWERCDAEDGDSDCCGVLVCDYGYCHYQDD